jgi:hypothetical protein
MRTTPYRTVRCPQCHASPNSPCHDQQRRVMQGVHFQRITSGRREFAAALHLLYAPLNPVVRHQLTIVS